MAAPEAALTGGVRVQRLVGVTVVVAMVTGAGAKPSVSFSRASASCACGSSPNRSCANTPASDGGAAGVRSPVPRRNRADAWFSTSTRVVPEDTARGSFPTTASIRGAAADSSRTRANAARRRA